MLLTCDKFSLRLCVVSPEQENHRFFTFVEKGDHSVGEVLSALVLVAVCHSAAYCEHGVQKKNT